MKKTNNFQVQKVQMENSEVKPPNRVAGEKGFKDKTLLVTGATGFLGKILVEKILRTCPDVKRIYVLVRNKRGKDPQARLKEMFSSPVFVLLKKTAGEGIFGKVTAIEGDALELRAGLSHENWKLLAEEVQIIYHLAATVRFDDSFKHTILLNTRGTKIMLELAKECTKLLIFAHVSTAYCFPQERILREKLYDPPANPHDIIKLAEILNEDTVELISEKLKNGFPNTYTYSKALAEGLVTEQMDQLPIIIIRPSLVVPVWREPLPGWINSIIGPTGLLIAAGKGILRSMYCKPDTYADFMPVDIVVNAMILSTYDYINTRERRIFNLTSSSHLKMSWASVIELGRSIVTTKMPFNWVVWYPGGSLKTSRLLHSICVVFLHFLPAVFLDAIIVLTGNKPILWRIHQKMHRGSELFEFYANNQWDFENEIILKQRKAFNKTERDIYKVDDEGLDVEAYLTNCIHAARLYILKENDESLPKARMHMKVMWAIDKLVKTLLVFWFGYLLLKHVVYPLLGMEL